MLAMEGERPSDWLTYMEASERVGCTAEIIRLRALRGKRVFEAVGVEFTNGDRPGVSLKKN